MENIVKIQYSSKVDEVADYKCKKCQNWKVDPRILWCLHSFCFKCIQNMIVENNVSNSYEIKCCIENCNKITEFQKKDGEFLNNLPVYARLYKEEDEFDQSKICEIFDEEMIEIKKRFCISSDKKKCTLKDDKENNQKVNHLFFIFKWIEIMD